MKQKIKLTSVLDPLRINIISWICIAIVPLVRCALRSLPDFLHGILRSWLRHCSWAKSQFDSVTRLSLLYIQKSNISNLNLRKFFSLSGLGCNRSLISKFFTPQVLISRDLDHTNKCMIKLPPLGEKFILWYGFFSTYVARKRLICLTLFSWSSGKVPSCGIPS